MSQGKVYVITNRQGIYNKKIFIIFLLGIKELQLVNDFNSNSISREDAFGSLEIIIIKCLPKSVCLNVINFNSYFEDKISEYLEYY